PPCTSMRVALEPATNTLPLLIVVSVGGQGRNDPTGGGVPSPLIAVNCCRMPPIPWRGKNGRLVAALRDEQRDEKPRHPKRIRAECRLTAPSTLYRTLESGSFAEARPL